MFGQVSCARSGRSSGYACPDETARRLEEAAITGTEHTPARAGRSGAAAAEAALAGVRSTARTAPVRPVGEESGSALRFLAAAIGARAVVEIGTGCGGSGIWLLRGMDPEGILTTVDVDPVCQEAAREAYRAAGFSANRTRLIRGAALEVLPRLTDGAYDMVFADAVKTEYPEYLRAALRLLRPGGVVLFHGAVDAAPDGPLSATDAGAAAVRETARAVHEDESLVPLMLPVGGGLLAAIRGGDDEA
ncbi:O-methyltransferase [Nocardiopsis baichengensis]|uniref:O-methyltransferase n=1 Tax=Nocardiopsis baichengensis TaxID=280240 RepID=UPI00035D9440|nr:class I SAM-dependent methyltransferase [Nocardiopsis baichengensis]